MAKGCCGQDSCSCIVQGGDGIEVTGSGTQADPYVVAMELPDFSKSMVVQDSPTVNLSLSGGGVPADPFVLSGVATLRMTDLVDVNDPQGSASAGESPVWVGDSASGHWEFQTPPPAPAGAVNATHGITGLGSAGTPLQTATSGDWGVAPLDSYGSDSTIGLAIYVDSAGELRTQPPAETAVTWASITGKPSSFPPSAHTHAAGDITSGVLSLARIPTIPWSGLSGVPATFPPSAHTHAAADITSGVLAIARIPTIPLNGLSGFFRQQGTPSNPSTGDVWVSW